MMARIRDRILSLCGASPDEVRLLAHAFATAAARLRAARARRGGLPPQAVDLLIGLYLFMLGLALAGAAVFLRARPGLMAMMVLGVHGLILANFLLMELYFVMLADEDHRVVASWPVRPASYLMARVAAVVRRSLALLALLCTPATVAVAIAVGTPVITGLVFAALALGGTLAAAVVVTALYALALSVLGAGRLRLLGPLALAGGILLPAGVALLLGREHVWLAENLAAAPRVTPLQWAAAAVELSAGQGGLDRLALVALALASMVLVPLACVRLAASGYARGLGEARVPGRRGLLARLVELPLQWLYARSRRPADAVVLRLLVAHLRGDWRFRAQIVLAPVAVIAVLLAEAGGADPGALFVDPFGPKAIFHPSMAFVALALIVPILTVPLLARSSDHGAFWMMATGTVSMDELATSGRRLLRRLFLAPIGIGVGIGYLAYGASPAHVAAHLVLLALLAELVLAGMYRYLDAVPFSRASDDQEIAQLVVVTYMLVHVASLMVAMLVVHVFYRWWLAYGLGVAWLLALRLAWKHPSGGPKPK